MSDDPRGGRNVRAVRVLLALCGVALAAAAGGAAALVWLAPGVLAGAPELSAVVERLRAGNPTHGADYVLRYGMLAAAANACVLLVLAATAQRWLGPRSPAGYVLDGHGHARWPGPVVVAVLAAMAASAWLAAPRLDQSLWDDEVGSVRHAIHGRYWPDAQGHPRFTPVPWWATLWAYGTPNNHVFYSVLARASHDAWQALADAHAEALSEPAVRLPAYLAGVASVGAVGLLGLQLGLPAAAAGGAWLLALHPWHVRYASEARGYALLMLLVPLSVALLLRALERGTWGRFAAFGAAQLLLLWTYPAVIFHVALSNAAGVVALALRAPDRAAAAQQLTRLAVVGLLGAVAWTQLMAPNVAQLLAYIGSQPFPSIDADSARRFGSFLLAGMPWGGRAFTPIHPELAAWAERMPYVVWPAAALAVLALLAGAVRLLRAGPAGAVAAAVLALAAPATFGFSWLREQYMFEQYLIFALPGAALLVAAGVAWPGAARGGRGGRALQAIAVAAAVLAFAVLTGPVRHVLRTRPIQPIRASVEVSRGLHPAAHPAHAGVLTASFYKPPRFYDPWLREIDAPEELRALMARADREGLELYVNNAFTEWAAAAHPELAHVVLDPERFEEIAVLPGFERRKTRHVFRYRGGGAP